MVQVRAGNGHQGSGMNRKEGPDIKTDRDGK
jgi:hypothetical protein